MALFTRSVERVVERSNDRVSQLYALLHVATLVALVTNGNISNIVTMLLNVTNFFYDTVYLYFKAVEITAFRTKSFGYSVCCKGCIRLP